MTTSPPAPATPAYSAGRRSSVLFCMIAGLSLAGIIVSAVSLQRHYAKSATTYCHVADKFDCDIVNRSEYSTLMGIPVAGIGVVGYGLLLVLSTLRRSRSETSTQLLLAALAGLGFALYLTYVEAYILLTWCILCLTSLALIALTAILAGVAKITESKSMEANSR
jgi:vitamin-K-epoxide reductase (warfarin-sensitive)